MGGDDEAVVEIHKLIGVAVCVNDPDGVVAHRLDGFDVVLAVAVEPVDLRRGLGLPSEDHVTSRDWDAVRPGGIGVEFDGEDEVVLGPGPGFCEGGLEGRRVAVVVGLLDGE